MMNSLAQFYKNNRRIILGVILIFFTLQLISVVVRTSVKDLSTSAVVSGSTNTDVINSKTDDSVNENVSNSSQGEWIAWLPLILFTIIASLIYLFQNWRLSDRLFSGIVLMRAGVVGNRRSGVVKWQISLSNRKKQPVVIKDAFLIFSSFTKTKKFKISAQNSVFPITVLAKDRYALTIELNHFYQRVPELTKYRLIRSEVHTQEGKTYKSFWRVVAVRLN